MTQSVSVAAVRRNSDTETQSVIVAAAGVGPAKCGALTSDGISTGFLTVTRRPAVAPEQSNFYQ